MLKEDRQVIHLEIKETGEHHYFGSVSALFAVYEDLMGIKFQTFRAKAKDIFTEDTPFENENEALLYSNRIGQRYCRSFSFPPVFRKSSYPFQPIPIN